MMVDKIKVIQVKSSSGWLEGYKVCVCGFGLCCIGYIVEVEDIFFVCGMINKVVYLVWVEGE